MSKEKNVQNNQYETKDCSHCNDENNSNSKKEFIEPVTFLVNFHGERSNTSNYDVRDNTASNEKQTADTSAPKNKGAKEKTH